MNDELTAYQRADSMGYQPLGSEQAQWPPVQGGSIYDANGDEIGGYNRIWRTDSGDTLSVHGGTYELRPYNESFAQLEEAIEGTALDKRGLRVKTEFTHNGGRCFRSYMFPHVQIETRPGDVIGLQILAFDSYDGSYSTSIAAGGFRFICLNGNFFGKTIQQLKVRHVKGSAQRFTNALDRVVNAAESFVQMEPRLSRWRQREINIQDFSSLVVEMPQGTVALRDKLVSRFALSAEESTLYGAWNVLTDWATKDGGTAQSRTDRDRRVAALIDSPDWRALEDA